MMAVVTWLGQPIAAYEDASQAAEASFSLPAWVDSSLEVVMVPVGGNLEAKDGEVSAASPGECRASGTAWAAPVTLSLNGNKNP